jgi:STAS-like domain of unknown function (DUF4325)
MQVAMKDFGDVLTGRSAASHARLTIEHQATAISEGQPIALDFGGVEAISVPFAGECIGGLLSGSVGGYHASHPILAVNSSEDVAETIDAALRLRRQALLSLSDRGAALLGGDPVLSETMVAAQKLGEFTATELAERMNLSPQAANNRLAALLRTRAISRSQLSARRGKEFLYRDPSEDAAQFLKGTTAAKRRAPRGTSKPKRAGTSRP